MTASSDWSVPRADRGREIHETAPVAHQDKRFPRRAPGGNRRRREQPPRDSADADAPPPPAADADTDADARRKTDDDHGASTGEEHIIDTLA